MKKIAKPSHGFTLIELMIAMGIFLFFTTALGAVYQSQQNSYHTQEQVSDMQQNLRAAMFFLERDIKMAGYDPREKAEAASNANNIAHVAEFRFALDNNLDGDVDDTDGDGVIQNDEYVRYALTNDADGNGMADGAPCHLGRETGIAPSNSGLEPVADNIDAMELVYHLADGTITTNPEDIHSIEISLLVRTSDRVKASNEYYPPSALCELGSAECAKQHANRYFPASNPTHTGANVWGPFNDSRQRKLLINEVKCRNLGVL